jgi:LPS export ABC transporter protein LptC
MIRGLSSANLINSSAQIFLQDRLRLRLIRFGWVALLFLQVACNNTELKEPLVYTGPLRKAENIELYYSEKDQVKVKMVAAEMQEFESGDREFPKGIYMEFYDEFGMMESTLRANQAYFFKKENQWRGRGKVEVKNIAKNEQLNTEELFWKPGEEKIFTEKFVTIRQQGDVIYGQGLVANQDMSNYIIKEPQGEFDVKEE